MRPSKVLHKLRNDEPVLCHALHFSDPQVYEMLSLLGVDCFWMDNEHHFRSQETMGNLIRATRAGGDTDCMARPAKGEFMIMMRYLEAGAHGILYPRCSGPEEAREVVRWAKFAPLGERGFDGGNPDMPYCMMDMAEYLKFANDNTFVVIQIEDANALSKVDEIAAVEGVDVIFLGPADFSILNGVPGQFNHAKIEDAIDKIAAAAKKHGKHWGMPAASKERAEQLMDKGARFLAHGADLIMVKSGVEKIQEDWASLGFSFNPIKATGTSYMQKA